MKKILMMPNIENIAKSTYLQFLKFEDSQHIGIEHAIYRILENIKINKSKKVLEIGLGISTISIIEYIILI